MFLKLSANRAWLFLLLATAVTYWLGESGTTDSAGMKAVLVMMGLAFLKGYFVACDFMELRHAPTKWRWFVMGWLTFVLSLVVLAYWIGLR